MAPRSSADPARANTLLKAIRQADAEHPGATLQVDVGADKGVAVVRVQAQPRVWTRTAEGPWRASDLDLLVQEGDLVGADHGPLGAIVRLPEVSREPSK